MSRWLGVAELASEPLHSDLTMLNRPVSQTSSRHQRTGKLGRFQTLLLWLQLLR